MCLLAWCIVLAVAASARAAVDVAGAPPGIIEGKVIVAATGRPLAGVKLRLQGTNDSREPALSGADGSFRLTGVAPGRAVITAMFPGEPPGDWVAEEVPVTVASGETRKDVLVRALKGGVAVVRVVSRDDRKPLADVPLTFTSKLSLSPIAATTGADGVAQVRLLPDRWQFYAGEAGGSRLAGGQPDIAVQTGKTNQVAVQVEPGTKITGTVRDPDGAPAGGILVSFNGLYGRSHEVTTDAAGRYELTFWDQSRSDFSRAGESSLRARSADGKWAVIRQILERTTKQDLTLQTTVTISAKAEDAAGRPVTNAMANGTMRIASLGFSLAEYNPAKADAQGQFEFAGIPKADVYTLSVSAKGYGSLSQQLQMPESPTNRLQFPTFVLPLANQVLGGQILDADGNPAARGLVQAWAISRVVHPVPGKPDAWDVQTVVGRTQGAAQTDSQGRFFFNAICEGPIQLTLRNLGPVVTVQTTAGATDIVLRLPNYRNDINNVGAVPAQAAVKITGTMRDPSGAPAAGVPVVWWNRGNVLETTDPLGRFSITWPNGADHMVLLARDMERNLSGIRELDGSITDVDLSLKPALTISVKAQDAGGRPIPTATGTLALKLDKTIMVFNWPLPVRADEQGCIEFQGLPQGMSYSATITSRGFTTATVAAPLEATRTNRLQLPPAVLRVPDLEDAEEYPIPDE